MQLCQGGEPVGTGLVDFLVSLVVSFWGDCRELNKCLTGLTR